MNNYRLLAALRRHLTLLLPLATPALLLNLALLVLGLAQSPNCHLSTLATVLPLDARRDNLIQRLRRWLKTPRALLGALLSPPGHAIPGQLAGCRTRPGDGSHRFERPREPAVCGHCDQPACGAAGLGGIALAARLPTRSWPCSNASSHCCPIPPRSGSPSLAMRSFGRWNCNGSVRRTSGIGTWGSNVIPCTKRPPECGRPCGRFPSSAGNGAMCNRSC